MASKLKIKVNGLVHNVTASLDTPLLYVLHNELHLHGPRFGCGAAPIGSPIDRVTRLLGRGGDGLAHLAGVQDAEWFVWSRHCHSNL